MNPITARRLEEVIKSLAEEHLSQCFKAGRPGFRFRPFHQLVNQALLEKGMAGQNPRLISEKQLSQILKGFGYRRRTRYVPEEKTYQSLYAIDNTVDMGDLSW